MSASTIDRLLRRYKDSGLRRPFSTTKPGSLLKTSIPIRTFAEWEENSPGFIEMDLVAHCGDTTEGFYLNTLSAVDIATGWVECQAVWGKGQERVGGAVHKMSRSLPFPLLGFDSDNGSEFINHHLYSYCQRNEITFTRSRPYRKNDGAHVEQKNWSVVRRLVGYGRYTSRPSLRHLERVYGLVGQYVNFFQPVMKLKHKSRNGAKVHKVYDTAQTPYHRLLEYDVLTSEQRMAMQRQYELLNPVSPNPPKDTDGRREDSGRVGEGATGEMAGHIGVDWRSANGLQSPHRAPMALCGSCDARAWRENTQQGTLADRGGTSLQGSWVSCRLAVRRGVEWLAAGPWRG